MKTNKPTLIEILNAYLRPSLWALRTRGDRSALTAVLRGIFDIPYTPHTNLEHLEATAKWLLAAQQATGNGGVAAFYDVRTGSWGPAYPETTGYIIPTFFNYSAYSGDELYRAKAFEMANWLLTLQLPGGPFPIGPLWPDWDRAPLVFDTGQIIHGLVRAFEESKDTKYLEAARRAGDWLIEIMDSDGAWRKYTSMSYVHVYNVRTAWALVRIYEACAIDTYRSAAMRNLDWALTKQDNDGWYRENAFRPEEDPLTHTIAYTIEGLLESGISLSEDKYIESATRAANALIKKHDQDGFLRARYGSGWSSHHDWSCMTGNAQIAMLWLILYQRTGQEVYKTYAMKVNRYIKQRQSVSSNVVGYCGGIAGSYPIYKDYEPFRELNWAAKFFIDSLLLQEVIETPTAISGL